MNFLKRLGQIAAQSLSIVTGIAPIVQPLVSAFNPKAGEKVTAVTTELQAIASVVQTIEIAGAAGGLDGGKKLQLAAPLVRQVILSSDLLAKHKIANPVKFSAGVDKITSGVADILSSLNDDVQTTDKT